jgi:hypothetical protein
MIKFKNPMAKLLINELRGIELGIIKVKFYKSKSNIPRITVKKKQRDKLEENKEYYCILLELQN